MPDGSRRLLGFAMLGGTMVLWTGSSVVVQMIFASGVKFEQPVFVTVLNSASSVCLLLPRLLRSCQEGSQRKGGQINHMPLRTVAPLSATIGLLWLLAQWIFNFSLMYTSVATNTVLSSTSSVFTFIFSLLICDDPFRWLPFGAAVSSFAGCTLVALQSPETLGNDGVANTLLGDFLALSSAAMFSLASVMLRKMAPEEFDIGFFMGINGCVVLSLSPALLLLAHLLGIEHFRPPEVRTLAWLAANAVIGCTFANYLYTSALLLLSPLVASVSMSLSIPLSAITDEVLLKQHQFSMGWAAGAALVGAGVLLVAIDPVDTGAKDIATCDRAYAQETELQGLLDEEATDDGMI
jgi:solute carrier family 35 protein F5